MIIITIIKEVATEFTKCIKKTIKVEMKFHK